MQIFYIPEIKSNSVDLNPTESKHMVKVLRLAEGDRVQVVDGAGGFYEAKITGANPKKCTLEILGSTFGFGKRNFRLHIAIAPTKNIDRLEWFLEKATEIGIDEITPVLCEHSERKVIKPERLEKIIVSAMKQSLKAYLPLFNPLISFNEFVLAPTATDKFIAHCYEGNKPHLKNVVQPGNNVLILIGPEGDFSTKEVELATSVGFSEVSLGNARLRTETAGVVACHIANLANE